MTDQKKAKALGEWKWEKYICLIGMGLLLIDSYIVAGGLDGFWRTNSFIAALVFANMFYLSEQRYRLFPDVRSD